MVAKNDSYSFNVIIVHPEIEKLKGEVDKLRTELSMLVLERDNLLHHECRNIEAAYMLAVGALEYKVYEIECAILRQKRMAEMIQAQKNRQEKVDTVKINNALDKEFAEYQAELNKRLGEMNAALDRKKSRQLTQEESTEFKKLYRAVVKVLHPDINRDLSEEQLKLFLHAIEAYKRGDLKELRIIGAMVSNPIIPHKKQDGLAALRKEKTRYAEHIKNINDDIARIKSEYPYTMKSFMQNPKEIDSRKTELEKHIKQLDETLSAYTEKIAEMLR
jgi:Mg2+ and Co2+ transporter CorA